MADQAAAMARGAEAMEQIRIQTERLLWDATPPDRMLANQEHFLTKQVVKVSWANTPWWRYQMETVAALLALCVGNSPVTGEFPAQRPVARNWVK